MQLQSVAMYQNGCEYMLPEPKNSKLWYVMFIIYIINHAIKSNIYCSLTCDFTNVVVGWLCRLWHSNYETVLGLIMGTGGVGGAVGEGQLARRERDDVAPAVAWREQLSDGANVLRSLRSHSRGPGVCATYFADLSSWLRKPSKGPPQS